VSVKLWTWTGQLCRWNDGLLIEKMEHSPYLSSPSPVVVLYSDHEAELFLARKRIEALEAALIELERPSVIRAAIRAAGDPDMEWWNKGWSAAVKRMRDAFGSSSETGEKS
jgi:hypothetical protein